jgi:hypothetical protein
VLVGRGVREEGGAQGPQSRATGVHRGGREEVQNQRAVVGEGGGGFAAVHTVAGVGREEKAVQARSCTGVEVGVAMGDGVEGTKNINPVVLGA